MPQMSPMWWTFLMLMFMFMMFFMLSLMYFNFMNKLMKNNKFMSNQMNWKW
uniref:ATP synthase F0 subunit 8 n=1 Tax=Anagonalia emeiensis TaxID=2744606 RepID=UPI00240EBEE9|nr:ATP synthase F0 subunit 8 [Anagonalia emeiensis]WEU75302.1 ATP synthase F0 subunit 8 [Anagonalia emeiensis]